MTSIPLQPPSCNFKYLYNDHLLPPCVCCTQMQSWWEEERRQLQAKIKTKDNIMSGLEDNIFKMEAEATEKEIEAEKLKQLKEILEAQVKELEQKIICLEISKSTSITAQFYTIYNDFLRNLKYHPQKVLIYKLQSTTFLPL